MINSELIKYELENESKTLEVRVEDDTVWLTQAQMVDLFQSTKQNISLHINNIFKEEELDEISTVKEYLTVQYEGKKRLNTKFNFIKQYFLKLKNAINNATAIYKRVSII